uniref:Uncharacterized protein n=1 Tax=Desertifilum tharense IPPAS B-1220 TaxID=1781255 RepID=A0ACD5GUL1_9CYAN
MMTINSALSSDSELRTDSALSSDSEHRYLVCKLRNFALFSPLSTLLRTS